EVVWIAIDELEACFRALLGERALQLQGWPCDAMLLADQEIGHHASGDDAGAHSNASGIHAGAPDQLVGLSVFDEPSLRRTERVGAVEPAKALVDDVLNLRVTHPLAPQG